jgi:hypothetical protein
MEAGPRIYPFVLAAATLAFTPLFDRAAIVTDVRITNPSANDNWTFSVGGRELFRGRVLTTGQQQPFGGISALGFTNLTLFTFVEQYLNMSMRVPIPWGQTLTVASVGGATADIMFELMEVDPGDLVAPGINDYRQNTFLAPIAGFVNAAVAAVGPASFDTQVAPAYWPNIFNNALVPPGWRFTLYALWLQGEGRNTFSGAANHVSATNDVRVIHVGQQKFTRAGLGFPLQGAVAAAGSANTVLEDLVNARPPFQRQDALLRCMFDPPYVIQQGDSILWQHDVVGDVTGGADYSPALALMLAKIERMGG